MAERRVVVTGLGGVTPLGNTTESSWENCINGVSGAGPITKFDASGGYKTRIAAEVKDFDPFIHMEKKDAKKMDFFVQYAVACAKMSLADADFEITEDEAEKVGVYIGAGLGGLPEIENQKMILEEKGPRKVSPFFILKAIANLAPGYVAILTGAKGPNFSTVSACATGSHAIGEAMYAIKRGDIDVAIAGGVEGTVTPLAIAGFNALRALSTRNDEPERASRPFDKDRDGFVLGEGGATLILEDLDHARKRGAKIYAELAGYGASCDAFHLTAPDPNGEGASRCMNMALRGAGMAADEINYVNAHGTSTGFNDYFETLAIKKVMGDHAYKTWVSSTKSMTGHCLGGAGAIEALFSVLAIHNGVVPPTINYETPDPECDLDYVPNTSREGDIRAALSNSFGFGGTNATLIFKRF
jgi:3-oxoacyl-[acyl-carrier-protein] synthase II